MQKMYVCYITDDNKGNCIQAILNKNNNTKLTFDMNTKKEFPKNCRTGSYGMKVEYIFEKGKSIFSCSDIDGSIQVYIFDESETYLKYENCISIYGYSIIYINDYYVASDVVCPEGIIPFNILISSSDYSPEIIEFTTNKEVLLESTLISETTKNVFTEVITNQITGNNIIDITNEYTEEYTDKYTEKINNGITEEIQENKDNK